MTQHHSALSRRTILGGAATLLGAGASALIATSAHAAKTAQKEAMYQEQPKDGKMCSGCSLFEAPGSCKVVDGKISPNGWCQFFAPKAG